MKTFLRTGKILAPVVISAALLFSGCGNSDNFVFTNSGIVGPGPAPVAANDSYPALGNATMTQAAAGGVLANDTLNGGVISSFDAVGSQGGALTLNADGSYSYTPAFNFVGAETFAYTLSNAGGDSTANITFTSTGLGIFVDNSTDPVGTGTQADPFDTLAEGLAVANAGDTIVVLRGNGTNTGLSGAVALGQGIDLIGEGSGLVLGQTVLPAGLAPVITGPVNCAGDNTVSGFTIEGSAGNGVSIAANNGNVTVNNNTISNPTGRHILGTNATGTVTITNNTLSAPPAAGDDFIRVENTDTNATVVVSNNTFRNDAQNPVDDLCEIRTLGTSVVGTTFSNNVANAATTDFRFGLFANGSGSSTQTVNVADNDFRGFTNTPVITNGSSSTSVLTGSISGNTFASPFSVAIAAQPAGGTLRIAGNMISNAIVTGISLQTEDSDADIIIENNQITGSTDDGVSYFDSDNGNFRIAFRDNTITNSGSDAVDVNWAGANSLCMEFTGNNFDDLLRLENSGAGTFNVQQLTNLATINNLNSIVPMLTGTINEANCNIP
ncbi:MAG: right-handed parallel beta-helix repeat-containing protein [Candidatus Eremiobacteraeota bacterium]|nr:right-handed parallel beta-helix repeat-containing protein [Candidatus Eremiobacteraeota bacterium]